MLDKAGRVLWSDYRRTQGGPVETAHSQLRELFKQLNPADVVMAAIESTEGPIQARVEGRILEVQPAAATR